MVKGGSPIPIFLELRDSTFDLLPGKLVTSSVSARTLTETATEAFSYLDVSSLGRASNEKSKVLLFQICCTRTNYLSEIYKNYKSWSRLQSYFQSMDLKGLSAKNWAQFGSSDF